MKRRLCKKKRIIREMQKKYNELSPYVSQNDHIKMSTNNKYWRGCVEKRTLLYCWWEYKLVQPLWRMVWRFLKKKKKKSCHVILQSHSLAYIWRKNNNLKRYIHSSVHSSTIYNGQDMEAT